MTHEDRAHAVLSASGSHTWLECTPSVRFVEALDLVKVADSPFAKEGTYCHEVGEVLVLNALGRISDDVLIGRLVSISAAMNADPLMQAIGVTFDESMREAAQVYADYVLAHAPDFSEESVRVEVKLDLTEWVPESFGTSDAAIVNHSKHVIDVIDLKYGKGVKVTAEGNPQLRLYALGVIAAVGPFDMEGITTVRLHIVQPRLGHISVDEISVRELLEWGEQVVKPRADMAWNGQGAFAPSEDACRWCLAKPYCKARFDAVQTDIRNDFADFNGEFDADGQPQEFEVSNLTDPADLARVWRKIAVYKAWLQDVEDEVNLRLRQGKDVPGLKLIAGRRSARKWSSDEAAVRDALAAEGYNPDEFMSTPSLVSPTQTEKLLGKKKFADTLASLTVTDATKPVVVDESDPRPAFRDEMGSDFA